MQLFTMLLFASSSLLKQAALNFLGVFFCLQTFNGSAIALSTTRIGSGHFKFSAPAYLTCCFVDLDVTKSQ